MKAYELTTPGLYWYSRDGEARGFAQVIPCGEGESRTLHFLPLSGDVAHYNDNWSMCSEKTKGDFFGPVPGEPGTRWRPEMAPAAPYGFTERAFAAIRLGLSVTLTARVLEAMGAAVPGCVARQTAPGAEWMAIEHKSPREPLDIVDHRTPEQKAKDGDTVTTPGIYRFRHMPGGQDVVVDVQWIGGDGSTGGLLCWRIIDALGEPWRSVESEAPRGVWGVKFEI